MHDSVHDMGTRSVALGKRHRTTRGARGLESYLIASAGVRNNVSYEHELAERWSGLFWELFSEPTAVVPMTFQHHAGGRMCGTPLCIYWHLVSKHATPGTQPSVTLHARVGKELREAARGQVRQGKHHAVGFRHCYVEAGC